MSKAKTAAEIRDDFMHTLANHARYWATLPDKTPLDRCNGLIHSVLSTIDGCNSGLSSFDLIARSHPDDKAFHQAEGSDWIEDGTDITDTMLHEIWPRYECKR